MRLRPDQLSPAMRAQIEAGDTAKLGRPAKRRRVPVAQRLRKPRPKPDNSPLVVSMAAEAGIEIEAEMKMSPPMHLEGDGK